MPRPQSSSKTAKGKNRAVTRPCTRELHFVDLALELRENVYGHILEESPGSLFTLFLVNRQLSREVQPFLFKRPLTFDGQEDMYQWLGHVNGKFLRHVRDVSFKLHDINPDEIAGALGKRLQQASITRSSNSRGPDTKENPYFEACHLDLKRVASAFRSFPNIQRFRVLGYTMRDPQPHERTLNAFSQLIGQSFPILHTLHSELEDLPIDFLSEKLNLRRLRFPGTTTTDEEELEEALEDLNLDELAIHRSQDYSYEEDLGCMPSFLEYLPPLKSLALLDESENGNRRLAGEVFLGSGQALTRHQHSLRSLRLLDNGLAAHGEGVKNQILTKFMEFVAASPSLVHLEVVEDYFQAIVKIPVIFLRRVIVRLDLLEGQTPTSDSIRSVASHLARRSHMIEQQRFFKSPFRQVLLYLDRNAVRAEKSAVPDGLRLQRGKARDVGIDLVWRFWEGEGKF